MAMYACRVVLLHEGQEASAVLVRGMPTNGDGVTHSVKLL
jgi:hypothetical protein